MNQGNTYVTATIGLFAIIILPAFLRLVPGDNNAKSVADIFQIVLQLIGALVVYYAVYEAFGVSRQTRSLRDAEEKERRKKKFLQHCLTLPYVVPRRKSS